MIDIEALVAAYLREASAVTDIAGDRVDLSSPESTGEPWIRVSLIDPRETAGDTTGHLRAYSVQCDCFAGQGKTRGEAFDLAAAAEAALRDIAHHRFDDAVLTGCRIDGCPRVPDDKDFDPPMERYALSATLWAHPR